MKILVVFLLLSSLASAGEWEHQSEVGIVQAAGNIESETYNLSDKTSYNWAKNTLTQEGAYLRSVVEDETGAETWLLGLRYDRELSKRFSLFIGNLWEGDRRAGFDFRSNVDVGSKYLAYQDPKNKKNKVTTELGYRFRYEQRIDGTADILDRSHILRSFTEWKWQWTDTVSTGWWVEILPDFSDNDNININTQPSVSVQLSKILALKVSYLFEYDNVPAVAGNKRIDTLYTTSLVAKF